MEAFDPNVFFGYEVLGGWLGGIGGGLGGFFLGLFLCLQGMGDDGGYAALGCIITGGGIGYLAGTSLGATLGVSIVGGINGVEGNVLMSALGGLAGTGGGMLSVAALSGSDLGDNLNGTVFFLGLPLLSSVGATFGYNVDAKRAVQN